jgi:molecular chaperone DnaK (HSP70)
MPGKLAIDFGTSNTVIAVWDESLSMGKPYHLSDYASYYQQGNERISIIPSLIHYSEDKRRWLGYQVQQRNLVKSERTFRWLKRYIANRSPVKRKINGKQVSFADAGKDFLSTVLLFASQELNIGNEEVVFTVPVEAFEHYENWLTEVAETAGMSRFRLIDEPSAAALGYGANIQAGDVYLIFDFGGGTLDVAVVLIEDEEELSGSRRCRILGKAGCDLGGTIIDQWMYAEVLKQTGYRDYDEEILQLSGAILVECEQAKINLSTGDRADITILNPHTGAIIGAEFTRSLFEEILEENDAFTNIDRVIRRALNDARDRGYGEDDIKAVLMVGGSSQIPAIQRTLKRIFGKERVMLSNPLDAVARGGAAFVAGVDFYDHIQHDYALRYFNRDKGDYDYRILVKRGTNYPTDGSIARLTIKASHDGQEHLGLAIFELGQRYQSSNNHNIELVFDPAGSARLTT